MTFVRGSDERLVSRIIRAVRQHGREANSVEGRLLLLRIERRLFEMSECAAGYGEWPRVSGHPPGHAGGHSGGHHSGRSVSMTYDNPGVRGSPAA